MSSHDALDVAEQNVNLHDSVHVGDVVQNINAANECPRCKTANVPVFSCMESNCSERWCTYCGTKKPGSCQSCIAEHERNRIAQEKQDRKKRQDAAARGQRTRQLNILYQQREQLISHIRELSHEHDIIKHTLTETESRQSKRSMFYSLGILCSIIAWQISNWLIYTLLAFISVCGLILSCILLMSSHKAHNQQISNLRLEANNLSGDVSEDEEELSNVKAKIEDLEKSDPSIGWNCE